MKGPEFYQREAKREQIEREARHVLGTAHAVAGFVAACGYSRHESHAVLRAAGALLDVHYSKSKDGNFNAEQHRGSL